MARAKPDVLCSVCKAVYKVTEKNIDARRHAENKHPKSTYEQCFPTLVEEDEVEDDEPADDELPESTKKWKCIFNGNPMFSDGYRMEQLYEGTVMEVKAGLITMGGNIVCNIVEQHKLKEVKKDKKAFMGMIKAYLKRIVTHLNENDQKDKVAPF